MHQGDMAPQPGIRGWIDSPARGEVTKRVAALGHPEGADFLRADNAVVAGWQHGGAQGHRVGNLLVAWAGTPRPIGAERADGNETAEAIAATFTRDPASLPSTLHGDFVLAAVDLVSCRAVLAVDRMGIRDLAWAQRGGALVFAPLADRVAADVAIRANLDQQAIYDYLFHHVVPRPQTVFADVHRLCPGEALVFEGGEARPVRYWQPTFNEAEDTPVAELEETFQSTLRRAVKRASETDNVGAFLSGGTDSSTITGMLGEVTDEAPRTYAIGFDAPGYDETAYARIAAERFGAIHHEYFVTPADVANIIPSLARNFDQPYGNASVVPAYYCAVLARNDGIDTLLGGDGGDELFAGNARYAKQWLFSLYGRIPGPVRTGLIEPALAVPGARRITPVHKLARYVEQANMPVPRRLVSWNLLMYIGAERLFTPQFVAAVDRDAPLAAITQEYERSAAYGLLNRLLAMDMKFTLADDDLRKVTTAGAMAGVETRFPFLDDDVVALAARVPPGLKLRRTRLRHFFKEALRDYLPQEILEKEKHGFGLPFGEWLRQDPSLRELARDSLDGLRSRGIVREQMIDELTDTRLEQHAGYFGTLTWVLMMLEQWFRHHTQSELQ